MHGSKMTHAILLGIGISTILLVSQKVQCPHYLNQNKINMHKYTVSKKCYPFEINNLYIFDAKIVL